jgi:hypothetical protein
MQSLKLRGWPFLLSKFSEAQLNFSARNLGASVFKIVETTLVPLPDLFVHIFRDTSGFGFTGDIIGRASSDDRSYGDGKGPRFGSFLSAREK